MHSRKANGFTLLELLVTLAVAAILLGIAIPSYRGLVQRNSVTTQVNDLVGDLNYARSQAVTRGVPVKLCVSANQATCATGGNWSQGWIVYVPDPVTNTPTVTSSNLLRTHSALNSQITMIGNQKVATGAAFDSNGFSVSSAGTITASGASVPVSTCVVIAFTGRISTRTDPNCT